MQSGGGAEADEGGGTLTVEVKLVQSESQEVGRNSGITALVLRQPQCYWKVLYICLAGLLLLLSGAHSHSRTHSHTYSLSLIYSLTRTSILFIHSHAHSHTHTYTMVWVNTRF